MSDYLNNLLARSRNLTPVVQPRLASLFEPSAAAAVTAGRPLFEITTTRDASTENESSPRASIVIPQQAGRSMGQHSHAAGSITAAPLEHQQNDLGQASESNEDLARHPPRPLSTAPLAPPSPTQTIQPLTATEPAPVPILQELRDSTRPPGPRDAGEKSAAPPATEANERENWSRIEPKVRRILDERLAPLRPVPARASEDTTANQPRRTPAPPPPAIAQPPDDRPRKPAQTSDLPVTTAESLPTINVSIGRVEVRAIISQQPAPAPRPARQAGALPLDEYLKQRSGGRR